jgi:hypothetical protein
MMFNAVLDDRVLRSKGFFENALYFDLDYYRATSKYHNLPGHRFKYAMYNDIKRFVSDVANWYESFEELAQILENRDVIDKDVLTTLDLELTAKMEIAERGVVALKQEKASAETEKLKAQLSQLESKSSKNAVLLKRLEKSQEETIDNLLSTFPDTLLVEDVEVMKELCMNDSLPITINTLIGERNDLSFSSKIGEMIEIINEINQSIREAKQSKELFNNGQQNVEQAFLQIENAAQVEDIKVPYILELLGEELQLIADGNSGSYGREYDSIIMRLYKNYYYVKNNSDEINTLAYLKWANEELMPDLAYINLKAEGKLKNVIRLSEALNALIEIGIYEPILEHFKSNNTSQQFKNLLNQADGFHANYLKFFQRLDELGEMETYYYLLNEMLLAHESCGNEDVSTAVKLIVGSVEKYTSFERSDDVIEMDVENIILTLANKYGNRDKNPLHFYMTVGMNNAFSYNENSLVDGDGNSISNFAFASEKIGVRLNLWNWKMRRSYEYGETRPFGKKKFTSSKRYYMSDPIVSNIHVLAYGSGLLYHLTDLGTAKNLNTTFIGTGLGLSFYNKLNFNTSVLFPVKMDEQFAFNSPVLNIGFDILFVDYLSELNKKRKAKKEIKKVEDKNQSTMSSSSTQSR